MECMHVFVAIRQQKGLTKRVVVRAIVNDQDLNIQLCLGRQSHELVDDRGDILFLVQAWHDDAYVGRHVVSSLELAGRRFAQVNVSHPFERPRDSFLQRYDWIMAECRF